MGETITSRRRARTNLQITRLWVSGYKSIRDKVELRIAPITLLAGANSSGKSSFLQPLLLLKQTIESQVDPGVLLLHGANVRVSNFSDIVSSINKKGASESINIGMEIAFAENVYRSTLVFSNNEDKLSVRLQIQRNEKSPVEIENEKQLNEDEVFRLLGEEFKFVSSMYRNSRVICARERFLFNLEFREGRGKSRENTISSYGLSGFQERALTKFYHVPALRGNPEPSYRAVGLGGKFPGTFDDYVASIINEWKQNDKPKLAELGRLLAELGLTWKVSSKKIDDTQVQILVGRLQHPRQGGAKDLVNIVQVGFAVSQVLPILVAVLVAKPGEVVYIEQPEIHLHPKAQVKLTGLLVRFAAQNAIKIVIETHSSLVLTGIQTEVARGVLPAADVSLNWFSRDDDGVTQVASGVVESDGSFGDWPEDFTEVELGASERFVRASSRRQASSQKSN